MLSTIKTHNLSIPLFVVGFCVCCLFRNSLALDTSLAPRLFSLVTFIILLFSVLLFRTKTILFSRACIPYFLFVLYVIASYFWAINKELALFEISRVIIIFYLLQILVNLFQQNKRSSSILLKGILLMSIISMSIGIIQLVKLPALSYENLYSVNGFSGHKNLYSSFLFLCAICNLLSIAKLNKGWKYLALITLVIQLGLIIILRTRTVWLAVIISAFVMLFFRYVNLPRIRKNNWIISISLMLCLTAVTYYVLPQLIREYKTHIPASHSIEKLSNTKTITERVSVWEKSFQLTNDYRFIGVGAGNWKVHISNYELPDIYKVSDLKVIFQRPHNMFIDALCKYGLLGFGIIVFFTSRLFTSMLLLPRKKLKQQSIVLGGLLGFLVISFFSFPIERIEHNIILTFLLALCISSLEEEKHWIIKPSRKNKLVIGISLVILLFLAISIVLVWKGEYYTKQAMYSNAKNKNESTIALCDKAISYAYTTDNVSIPIAWYRGSANAKLRRYNESLNDFKAAYKLSPYNPYILNDLGSAYYTQGNSDSAKYFYKESHRINNRYDEPLLNLIAILISEGQLEEANSYIPLLLRKTKRQEQYRQYINKNLKQ